MNALSRLNPAAAVLWASAFLIAAMVIVMAGRLPSNAAYAAVASAAGDIQLLTADSGRGAETRPDQILYVIDSRDQIYYVYEIENIKRNQMTLRAGGSLEALFQNAKP